MKLYWPAGAERPVRYWPAGTTETLWLTQCAARLSNSFTNIEPQTSPPQPATTNTTTKSAQQEGLTPDTPKEPAQTQVQIAAQLQQQLQQLESHAPPQKPPGMYWPTEHRELTPSASSAFNAEAESFVPGGISTDIKHEVTSFGSVKSRVEDTDSCPSDGQGDELALIHSYYQGLKESIAEQGFPDKLLTHLALTTGGGRLTPELVIEQLEAGVDALSDSSDSAPLSGGSRADNSDYDNPSDANILDFVHDAVVSIANSQGDTTDWVGIGLVFDEARKRQISSYLCMDAIQNWCSLNVMIISPCKGYVKLSWE